MNYDLLFIYGTLLDNNNEFGQYIQRNAEYLTQAVFNGRLFDCGEYPGAIVDEAGYKIKGSIYRLRNPAAALALLDDYEGFGDEQEQPNLFIRKITAAEYAGETIDCWVYIYNLPVEGLTEITSGDYIAYINS